LNDNNQLEPGLSRSSNSVSLSDANKANNKALLKVYGVGFSAIILMILALLFSRDDGVIEVSTGTFQDSVIQSELEITDELDDSAAISIAQLDELDLQIQQRNSEILGLQEQLQELSRSFEEEQIRLAENNSNENNAAPPENILIEAQNSEQILSLTAALSSSNAKVLQLEEDLRTAADNALSMQNTISELTDVIKLVEEQTNNQFSQFEATISERNTVIQELGAELEQLQNSIAAEIAEEQLLAEDYLPLVAIAPEYPTRAAQRGIEGWCLVSFTVDEVGNVVEESIQVVDAEPANTFDRSSSRAAARFKFQPRVVGGEGVSVDGVQYLFRYQLEDN